MAAIPAQRFKVLDEETNVPYKDFLKGGMDSQILNGGQFTNPDILAQAQSMLNAALGELPDLSAIIDPLQPLQRAVKDIKGSAMDLKGLIGNKVGPKLDDVLKMISGGDSVVSKALKTTVEGCINPGVGYGLPGRPFDVSLNCGSGGPSNCNVSGMSDLLNKLSGGGYQSGYKDLNALLRKITSLAGMSYSAGLCGAFAVLTQGVESSVKTRAAASLLSNLGESRNSKGVFDLANSSVGLPVKLENPGGVGDFLSNFKKPYNTKAYELPEVADQVLGSAEIFDENWATSVLDDMPSIAETRTYQEDLDNVFYSRLSNRAYDETSLDDVLTSDEDFALSAYSMMA